MPSRPQSNSKVNKKIVKKAFNNPLHAIPVREKPDAVDYELRIQRTTNGKLNIIFDEQHPLDQETELWLQMMLSKISADIGMRRYAAFLETAVERLKLEADQKPEEEFTDEKIAEAAPLFAPQE